MSARTPARQDGTRLLLGIDIGTSRLKAAVYDGDLRVLRESDTDTRSLGAARSGELDARSLWRALHLQLAALVGLVDSNHIVAIGITGMAESGCLIDALSHPVTPMLLWHDRRGIRQAADLRRRAGTQLLGVTGLRTTSVRSIAKWMWLADHGASREARWCGAPEWIALCLTGVWRTDATLAVRTGAFDVLKGQYSSDLLDLAGAPAGLFPPVHGTPACAGPILPSLALELGLPETLQVMIAGHDDIVAAFGAGGEVGDLIDSGGTAEGLIRVVDKVPAPAETLHARMAMTRFFEPGTWALIAGAGSTGALMQLTAEMLGQDPAALDDLATGPGQYDDGLIDVHLSKNSLPAIKIRGGAAAPEVWSAVLDLVCDRLQHTAARLEGLAGPPSRLILTGGAAHSRELVRRKSARLGLPAVVLPDVDATTRGASALADLACQRAQTKPTSA